MRRDAGPTSADTGNPLEDLLKQWQALETERVAMMSQIVRHLIADRPQVEPTEYLTTSDLARRMRVGPSTLRALCANGTLVEGEHYVLRGRKRMFRSAAMERWFGAQSAARATSLLALAPKSIPFLRQARRMS